jgi:hypothetical protein
VNSTSVHMVAAALGASLALSGCDEVCPDEMVCLRGQFVAMPGESTGGEEVRTYLTPFGWDLVSTTVTDADGRFEVVLYPREWWNDPSELVTLYVRLEGRVAAQVELSPPVDPGSVLEVPPIRVWPLDLRTQEEGDGVRLHWTLPADDLWPRVRLSWLGSGASWFSLGWQRGLQEAFAPSWLLEDVPAAAQITVPMPGEGRLHSYSLSASARVSAPDPVLPLSRGAPCTLRQAPAEGLEEPLLEVVQESCAATDGDAATLAALADATAECWQGDWCPRLRDVTVDLGDVTEVRRVVVRNTSSAFVLASVDGETWHLLSSVWTPYEREDPVDARYIRVEFDESGGRSVGQISVF